MTRQKWLLIVISYSSKSRHLTSKRSNMNRHRLTKSSRRKITPTVSIMDHRVLRTLNSSHFSIKTPQRSPSTQQDPSKALPIHSRIQTQDPWAKPISTFTQLWAACLKLAPPLPLPTLSTPLSSSTSTSATSTSISTSTRRITASRRLLTSRLSTTAASPSPVRVALRFTSHYPDLLTRSSTRRVNTTKITTTLVRKSTRVTVIRLKGESTTIEHRMQALLTISLKVSIKETMAIILNRMLLLTTTPREKAPPGTLSVTAHSSPRVHSRLRARRKVGRRVRLNRLGRSSNISTLEAGLRKWWVRSIRSTNSDNSRR